MLERYESLSADFQRMASELNNSHELTKGLEHDLAGIKDQNASVQGGNKKNLLMKWIVEKQKEKESEEAKIAKLRRKRRAVRS